MSLAFIPLFCPRTAARQGTVMPVAGLAEWEIRRFTSAEELQEEWPRPKRNDGFWLQPEVLSFQMENPQGVSTEPLVVENIRDGRFFQLTAQTFYFNAGGQVSDEAKGDTSGFDLRRRLLSPFSFRVLCLGQFLVSGGFASEGLEQLSQREAAEVLPAVAETLMARCRSYAGVIIKDLYREDAPTTKALRNKGFYLLPTDPLLEVKIAKGWDTIEDYLADLKSKYRVRFRRARAKMEGLARRRLPAEEVAARQEQLYQLYRETASGSDFNAVALTPQYFPWLANYGKTKSVVKEFAMSSGGKFPAELERERTNLHGYFNTQGELVGFTSAIANGATYHAHFLGMKAAYKQQHHLYHNMLFDLLEDAITGGFSTLDYARTAPEIKTSVGAVASDHAVLLRARSKLINRLVPIFTPAVYKTTPWTARNPFRG